jgi:hypothetical protein
MRGKTIGWLLGGTIILAAAALLLRSGGQNESGAARIGERLFPSLPVEEVARITVTGHRQTVLLRRGEEGWTVTERFGYPADFNRIAALVEKIADLRIGRQFAATPEVRARLGLNAPGSAAPEGEIGVQVRLGREDGKPDVAAFLLGKPREAAAPGGGQYVLAENEQAVSLVDREFEPLDETTGADWIDKQVLNAAASEIESVVCRRFPEGPVLYRLRRPAKGQKAILEGEAPAGQRLLDYRIEQLFEALSPLKVSDVAGPVGAGEDQRDESLIYEFTQFDGAQYRLVPGTVPAGQEEKRTLRISAQGAPQGQAERLGAWIYLIEPWQAELFVTDVGRFYEKSR